jgi:sodium-dependent dicarboxylate transporter 2/3/5
MAYGTKYVGIPGIFKAGLPLVIVGVIVTLIVLLAVLNFAPWLISA